MNYSRFVMTGVMLTIFTVMVSISSTYPPGARFMTFVIGFPAIALCLLQLSLDLRAWRNAAAGGPDGEKAGGTRVDAPMQMGMNMPGLTVETYTPEVVRREIIVWSYILGLVGSILLFGFYVSIPAFLIVFLRFFAEASWRFAAMLTAAAATFMYVLFEYVFRMSLHAGFVTDYLMDFISG